jgi:type II secretory ATPase GspE/PulE/Tfp pilus assembly ATPase PilB-like protein
MKSIPTGKKFGQLLVQHGFISEQQLKEALHHQETRTPYRPLGEICVDLGFISTVVLRVVLDRYRKQRLLGDLLLKMGVVSADQLSEALSEQKRGGKRLGQTLLDKRDITKADLAEALSTQLGISKIVPSVYMVDPVLLSKVPPEYLRKHRVVPLLRVVTSCGRNKEIVTVLMEDPLDITTIADLGRVFNAEIQPAVSATLDLEDFLNEIFEPRDRCPVVTMASDPGVPVVHHQTKDTPQSRNDVTASPMKLEEQNYSIPGLAVQGGGATEIGRDDSADVKTPSSAQPPCDDVTETETSDLTLPSNKLFEAESISSAKNNVIGAKLGPEKQNYSRMSDLTVPANRLPEAEPPSLGRNDGTETKTEPKEQSYSRMADVTLPADKPPETEPTSSAPWDMAKFTDLSIKDAPSVELSAPTKGMVIDERDYDSAETGTSAVAMLNAIVFSAVRERASDIHIEPLEGKVCIRYRIDGVLRHKADLPKAIAAALTTRVKVLSGLDIAERRRHQDGRIEARIADKDVDLRVSTYAALWGENVVMRILNRETALVDINKLGLSPLNLDRYLRILTYPAGIILVTGPTGSGKTTTLYASLMHLRDNGIKIITVEDPVEYTIEGVVQGRLDSRPDLSYEDFIKSMMRQDPDVIMIGEIRDEAGAGAAMQASLTGHKVLTSFHTDDTVSAILRLMDMNIQPFLISSTIVGIMAQRLARTLCPFCKEATIPDESVMRTFKSIKTKGAFGAYTFYRPVGCPECGNTGYKGRTGVHELLEINEPVKEAILARKTASQIRLAARESAQLISMAEDGFYKAAQGITTLQEVLRLVFINACDASVPYNVDNLMAYCDGAEDSDILQLPKAHNRA